MKPLAGHLLLLLCLAALLAARAREIPHKVPQLDVPLEPLPKSFNESPNDPPPTRGASKSPSDSPADSPAVGEPVQDNHPPDPGDVTDILKPLQQRQTCEDQALAIDAHLIARKSGWDVEATKRHMQNQAAFSSLVDRVFSLGQLQGRYAGSAMASAPGEEATLWIKDKMEEEEAKTLHSLIVNADEIQDMSVKIVDGMRFSEADQEARADAIVEHLEKTLGTAEGIGAAVRPGDLLLITLPATDAYAVSERREAPSLGAGGDMVDEELVGDLGLLPEDMWGDVRGIVFEFTEGGQDVDQHARGGRGLWGEGGQCTSGFSVYRMSDGMNGITTAGHCTNISAFDAESPEADFALYHKGEHCGRHGDVEWKTTSHVELAEFWASPTDRRDVRSVESVYSVNNWYCLYSRITGARTCDKVFSSSTSQSGCQGRTSHRLVAMESKSGVGGDSGGPWSVGTKAAGVVKGHKTVWFEKRSTFTKASRFDDALGVRIKTVISL